ncbi:MAG: bifunctional heptose 7-phosphate kinase/heptose 1-phosphate adenyltransferase [Pyrinomonadaceae bacterium]
MRDLVGIVRDEFPSKRVVIVGDLVADQFLRGTISRVSREAPVFILRHDETETRPGGAANAAANLASLGSKPWPVGVVGDDSNGALLMEALRSRGIDPAGILIDPATTTTTKVRVLAGQHYAARQQVIRIDYENRETLSPEVRASLHASLSEAVGAADAIICSDYNYGVVDDETFRLARQLAGARDIPFVVDSRFRLAELKGATAATPNQEEVEQLIGSNINAARCEELRKGLGLKAMLVTRGNKGMLLVSEGAQAVSFAAIGSEEPVDVTGAGDTVIAVFALGLASGMTYEQAAIVANHAGGIVVMKKGTATISSDELIGSLQRLGSSNLMGSAA